MGCAAGKKWEIRLALEEALMNAIERGGTQVHLRVK
jgi:anti-sigma regulatory factor (Ser/Thr protein kinase)